MQSYSRLPHYGVMVLPAAPFESCEDLETRFVTATDKFDPVPGRSDTRA